MRVDSHQHFWRHDPPTQAWITDDMAALRRDYLPSELRQELVAAGFDGSVAVQAAQSLDETRFLLELADAHPFVRGVVGWVDLRAPGLAEVLAEFSSHPRFKGVRHVVQSEPPGFLADSAFRAGVASLARFGLCYDVLIHAHQLPEAIEFVQALPEVGFVLDHLGKPPIEAGQLEPWSTELRRLARAPNVCCKVSGLVTEASWNDWRPADLTPFLDVVVESFGAQRLLVGSDWPVCTLAGSYGRVMAVFDDYFASFSATERAGIFGDNAERVYRLTP